MPDITDPQVVLWANTRTRTITDQMTRLYADLVAHQADYTAQNILAKLTAAGVTNNVADGYATDGRPIITGTSMVNLSAAIAQLRVAFDAAVTGVGLPVTTIQNGIQVNGSPR